ncbi:MAG: uracil-DNA glycosylase [Mobilicoccus sp.]|nr:uracil-DNA glycosylase [Mobilicoccus sp.]
MRHPVTGDSFDSPVPPGTGWPGDPADAHTPVAQNPVDVERLAATGSIADLDARSSVCRACPRLVTWRETVATEKRAAYADEPYWGRPVPSFGDEEPRLLVVGLAPAAHGANRTGRLFTGDRSGDWIFAALHRAGFANQPDSRFAGDGMTLTGVRILAPVRCAPPANAPTPAERHTCGAWLDRELHLLAPHVRGILALGGIGWAATVSAAQRAEWEVPRPRPRFGHGAEVELTSPHGVVRLVGSYHVSQQNTFTGRLTEPMLDAALARAAEAG